MSKSGTFLGYRDEHGNEMHCSREKCDTCGKCEHPVAVQGRAVMSPVDTITFKATKALIRNILERPNRYHHEWTVQGFGMLRCYPDVDRVWRLNVWHSSVAVPNVSTVHDHPWDFTSLVVAGRFTNRRYLEQKHKPMSEREAELMRIAHDKGLTTDYNRVRIQTGEGGGIRGEPTKVVLIPRVDETYTAGNIYRQQAEEVHESVYVDGTVTINERIRRPDGEHANVFYPTSTWWNDAEPRQATLHEINRICDDALEHF